MAIEASGWGRTLKKLPAAVQHVYSLILIIFGWILFRITDISLWGPFIKALVGVNGWRTDASMRYFNILQFIPILILGVLFSLPFVNTVEKKILANGGVIRLFWDLLYLLLFILSVAFILTNGYNAFIYAQFLTDRL